MVTISRRSRRHTPFRRHLQSRTPRRRGTTSPTISPPSSKRTSRKPRRNAKSSRISSKASPTPTYTTPPACSRRAQFWLTPSISTPNSAHTLAARQSVVAHCPVANTFLRSGIMPRWQYHRDRIRTSLASDIGAGTERSMPRVAKAMIDAAKFVAIEEPQATVPAAAEAWWQITRGNADALGWTRRRSSRTRRRGRSARHHTRHRLARRTQPVVNTALLLGRPLAPTHTRPRQRCVDSKSSSKSCLECADFACFPPRHTRIYVNIQLLPHVQRPSRRLQRINHLQYPCIHPLGIFPGQ